MKIGRNPSTLVIATIVACILALMPAAGATAAATKLVVLVRNADDDLPDAVVQQFERQNSDIQIELVRAAWNEIDDKFLTMTAADQPIDVMISMSLAGWGAYAYQGLFLDLNPLIKRDRQVLLAKGVPAFVLEGLKISGKTTSIAYMLWASFLTHYNATFFDEAGIPLPAPNWADKNWTWDVMVQAAKKLTRFNADGQLTRAGVQLNTGDVSSQSISLMWGGDVFAPETYQDNIVRKLTFDTPANRQAFSAAAALSTEYRVTNYVYPQAGTIDLARGTSAMYLAPGGTFSTASFTNLYTWGMAPLPLTPVLSQRVPLPAWVRAVAIHSRSMNTEAAWRFVKFLLTDAYEMGMFDVNGVSRSWNDYRGVNYTAWQRHVQLLASRFTLAHPPDQLTQFLAQAIGEYTRLSAANALVGGGDTIHTPSGPLYLNLISAYQGKIPVEQALQQSEREGYNILSARAERLGLK